MTCLPPVQPPDPMLMTSKELVALACAIARVGAVLCDLGDGDQTAGRENLINLFSSAGDSEPYIWDTKED